MKRILYFMLFSFFACNTVITNTGIDEGEFILEKERSGTLGYIHEKYYRGKWDFNLDEANFMHSFSKFDYYSIPLCNIQEKKRQCVEIPRAEHILESQKNYSLFFKSRKNSSLAYTSNINLSIKLPIAKSASLVTYLDLNESELSELKRHLGEIFFPRNKTINLLPLENFIRNNVSKITKERKSYPITLIRQTDSNTFLHYSENETIKGIELNPKNILNLVKVHLEANEENIIPYSFENDEYVLQSTLFDNCTDLIEEQNFVSNIVQSVMGFQLALLEDKILQQENNAAMKNHNNQSPTGTEQLDSAEPTSVDIKFDQQNKIEPDQKSTSLSSLFNNRFVQIGGALTCIGLGIMAYKYTPSIAGYFSNLWNAIFKN